MTIRYGDRVKETSNSTGTGNFALNLAAVPAFRKINIEFNNDFDATGLSFDYVAVHSTDNTWEIGTGHLISANVMSRDIILLNNSEGTSKVNFASGGVFITVTPSRSTLANLEAEKIIVDNIQIDGNTISSLDTDGNINLTPNGTGEVVVNSNIVLPEGSATITSTVDETILALTGVSDAGISLAQITQTGTGNALKVGRVVGTPIRPLFNLNQSNATSGGTQAVLLIQQAQSGSIALGINEDNSLVNFNFSVDSLGNIITLGITASGTITSNTVAATIFSGNILALALLDNLASIVSMAEGSNNYFEIDTLNGSELIAFGNATTNPDFTFLGLGLTRIGGSFSTGGLATPDGATGSIHCFIGSAGAVSSPSSGVIIERDASAGVAILIPDLNTGAYTIGTPSKSNGFEIEYDFTNAKVTIGTRVAGHTTILTGDDKITNITLSGASGSPLITAAGDITIPSGYLNFGTPVTLTISSGVVTSTQSNHKIETEASAATDDLDTINGGTNGDMLFLSSVDATRDPTAKDGTGNLRLAGDFTFLTPDDSLSLKFDGTNWIEQSRSTN